MFLTTNRAERDSRNKDLRRHAPETLCLVPLMSGQPGEDKADFPRYKEREMWLRDELTRRYRSADDGRAFLAGSSKAGQEDLV